MKTFITSDMPRIDKNMPLLVFDASHAIMGEIAFHQGALMHCLLSARGEEALGEQIREWQAQGISYLRDVHVARQRVMIEARVQPRSRECEKVMIAWFVAHGFVLIHVPSHVMSMWEKLTSLPFTPQERLLFLRALCRAPVSDMKTWNGILDEARAATTVS